MTQPASAQCRHCGFPNAATSAACAQCGAPLQAMVVAPPAAAMPANPYAPPTAPAYRPAPQSAGPSCQSCNQNVPTTQVTFMQNVGLLIVRFSKQFSGPACRRCADDMFWRMTLITFFFGWWGVISFFYTLISLPVNVTSYVRSRSLPQ